MKSLNEVKVFYKDATIDTNPVSDRAVLSDALKAGGLTPQGRTARGEPRIWRFIVKNSITRSAAAALVVLVPILGISLLNRTTAPAYGLTNALELFAQARTMHIQGWRLGRPSSSGEPVKLLYEEWIDLENDRYYFDIPIQHADGTIGNLLHICDGQYAMIEGGYTPRGEPFHPTVEFRRADPGAKNWAAMLKPYEQLNLKEGFKMVGREVIRGESYDMWQGEYDSHLGTVHRVRLQAWISPDTGNVGRTRSLRKEDDQWVTKNERTLIELNVPLPEDIIVTEPRPGFEITTPKEEATVPVRRRFDIYYHTEFNYAPLRYWVEPLFVLKGGSLLACWQGVDNMESRDQSKYFEGLQTGGDLPKLPVEVFALSPQPNVRDVMFVGFHLAHTMKETELGRRWYEWSLFIPDKEPPEPDAVLHYGVHTRLNVERTDSIGNAWRQPAVDNPQTIDTEADFEVKVLKAMADRSDDGSVPEHMTYENVMRIAEQLQALIAK